MPHSGLGASNAGVTDNSVGGTYSNHPDYASSSGPQTESAPYEGTGTSQYGNNVESSTSGTAGEDGVKHGGGAKGIAAAVHGVGEKIRGTFNKGVDGAFHEGSGVAKNDRVASDGDNEMNTGNFSTSTKN